MWNWFKPSRAKLLNKIRKNTDLFPEAQRDLANRIATNQEIDSLRFGAWHKTLIMTIALIIGGLTVLLGSLIFQEIGIIAIVALIGIVLASPLIYALINNQKIKI